MIGFPSGLIHTPVTPFSGADKIDGSLGERLVDFHIAHRATAICVPTHIGESPSLTDEERQRLIGLVLRAANGRVPVIAHVSRPGTLLTVEAARQAEEAGAAAVMVSAPYYWTPPAGMLLEHFTAVARSIKVPVLVYNAPDEMGGVELSVDLVLRLVDRADNFAGIVDASLDWQSLIDLIPRARKRQKKFAVLSGMEHMVSMQAMGGAGSFSALSAIAPNLVRQLFELCVQERYEEARPLQFTVSELQQTLKPSPAKALKAALEMLGRPVGETRPPVMPLPIEEKRRLWKVLERFPFFESEPHGW